MAGVYRWFVNLIQRKEGYSEDESSYCIKYAVSSSSAFKLASVNVCHYYEPQLTLFVDSNTESIDDPSLFTHVISTEHSASLNLTRILSKQLDTFSSLTHLIIINIGLGSLPHSIGLLRNLLTLDATGNRLIEIPESVGYCTKLQKLFAMNNKLKHLPKGLLDLPLLEQLEVAGNPALSWPPLSVALEGVAAVKSFMVESLSKENERKDLFRHARACGSSLYGGTHVVPTLQEIVTSYVLENKMKFAVDYVPPRLKNHLTVFEDFSRFHITISKCSHCLKYFSSEVTYETHVCHKKPQEQKLKVIV